MTVLLVGSSHATLQPIADYVRDQFGCVVDVHDMPTSALRAAQQSTGCPTLMIADISGQTLAGAQGFLRAVHVAQPDMSILVLATYEQAEQADLLLRLGAMDVLIKPVPRTRLRIAVMNAQRLHRLRHESRRAWVQDQAHAQPLARWQSTNPLMLVALRQAHHAARSDASVWLHGAFGTGRYALAQAIHAASSRAHGPFEAVLCAHADEEMLVRQWFGGHSGRHAGLLARLAGGTLYLDAAEHVPEALWPRMYDAMAQHSVRLMVGTTQSMTKFVALRQRHSAANAQAHTLLLPSLAQRAEDIPMHAQQFLARYAAMESLPPPMLTPDALAWLQQQPWRGNLPELAQMMHRLVVYGAGQPCDVAQLVQWREDTSTSVPMRSEAAWSSRGLLSQPVVGVLPALDTEGRVRSLAAIEEDALRFALEHYEGCMARAARALGIGRSTLYRKLHEREPHPQSA